MTDLKLQIVSYPDGNVDMGLNLRDYMVRKSADAESKEDSKNKRLPKYLRNFLQIAFTMWMEQACFIMQYPMIG